jgi:hypothetical protein
MTNARARGFGRASRVKRPIRVAMSLCFASSVGLALVACSSKDKPEPPPVDIDMPPLLPENMGGEIFDDPAEVPGEGLNPSQVCVGQEAGTELAPAIVELLVDTSLSMDEQAPGSRRSKWLETRDVILQGIDVMPATTSLGVVFYPDVEVGDMPCFDSEADVAIESLGGDTSRQRTQIREAFASKGPRGSTPTHDAYRYALDQVAASTKPGQRFLVLITDGIPTYALGCEGSGNQEDPADPTPLIPEAASALGRGIKTFVIGSPGSEGARRSLSQMAEAGGTAAEGCSHTGTPRYCHFDMTEEPNFTVALRDALASISGLALACAYDIPPPPSGSVLDRSKVNVLFTPEGGDRETIGQSVNGCTEGWQFSSDGSQILLCGDTCDRVRSSSGQVTLQFGCSTQSIDVR